MHQPDPTMSPTKARSALARASVGDNLPPEQLRLHRANLACANIDNTIRQQVDYAELDPVHVGHLVGLLLMESGVEGSTVTLFEKLARDAVATVRENGAER